MNATTKTARVEPLSPDLLQAREAARLAEYERACLLNKASAPAPVPQSVMDKLAEARMAAQKAEILKATNPKKNRKAIKDHQDRAQRLRNQARDRQAAAAEVDWSNRAQQETIATARSRGEMVETTAGGPVRISSRDGLRSLRQAGHITDAQHAVGLLYRAGHEARGRDLKIQTFGDSSGGGHDHEQFVGVRFDRAKMLDFTARTDRAVACACISRPSALQMLRSVAGEGSSLSAWGEGRSLARNREALIEALDIAAAVAKAIAQDRGAR